MNSQDRSCAEQGRAGSPVILELKGVSKRFGGLTAVSNLSFQLREQEILGVIGPNGAGKTTVFNLIGGQLSTDSGSILLRGHEISDLRTSNIAKQGIARTFQGGRIFGALTVSEHILTGLYGKAERGVTGTFWRSLFRRENLATFDPEVSQILGVMGLASVKNETARNLTYVQQNLLGIGVAIATGCKLLLLDEPLAGMNEAEVGFALSVFERIRQELGIAIMLVEHHLKAVMSICDWIVVLNFGEKIAEGVPEEVCRDQNVISCYMGEQPSA